MTRGRWAVAVVTGILVVSLFGLRSTGPNGYSVWYCYPSGFGAWLHSARQCAPGESPDSSTPNPGPSVGNPDSGDADGDGECDITDNPDGSVKTDWRGEVICG